MLSDQRIQKAQAQSQCWLAGLPATVLRSADACVRANAVEGPRGEQHRSSRAYIHPSPTSPSPLPLANTLFCLAITFAVLKSQHGSACAGTAAADPCQDD